MFNETYRAPASLAEKQFFDALKADMIYSLAG